MIEVKNLCVDLGEFVLTEISLNIDMDFIGWLNFFCWYLQVVK